MSFDQFKFLSIDYDKVSANSATSVPRTSEFQDGHRVLKKGSKRLVMYVYGIQCNSM